MLLNVLLIIASLLLLVDIYFTIVRPYKVKLNNKEKMNLTISETELQRSRYEATIKMKEIINEMIIFEIKSIYNKDAVLGEKVTSALKIPDHIRMVSTKIKNAIDPKSYEATICATEWWYSYIIAETTSMITAIDSQIIGV